MKEPNRSDSSSLRNSSQASYQFHVIGKFVDQRVAIRHFKILKIETGSDGATDQRVSAGVGAPRREPTTCRDHADEGLSSVGIRSDQQLLIPSVGGDDVYFEGAGSGIVMPEFIGSDSVK